MSHARVHGLIVRSGPLTVRFRAKIVDLATKYRLPAIYNLGEFARDGGLVAYGPNVPAVFRRMATTSTGSSKERNPVTYLWSSPRHLN